MVGALNNCQDGKSLTSIYVPQRLHSRSVISKMDRHGHGGMSRGSFCGRQVGGWILDWRQLVLRCHE